MSRLRSMAGRSGLALLGMVAASLWWAPVAAADPAAPTDYRATVRSIEPPVAGLEVSVVGGDAFLWLRNGTGHLVEVHGYQGEPYLRFRPDGVVEENQAGPTAAANRDRRPAVPTGPGEPAAPGQPAAAARWRQVAVDGSYAWHDHRAHWMSPIAPLGRQRGDEILDATVPIEVDGQPVAVRASVVWERRPHVAGLLAMAAAVAAALALGARRWGWGRSAPPALLVAAVLAVATTWWEHRSLPIGVAPSSLRSLPPLLAALSAVVAWRAPGRRPQLALLGASQVVMWGWLRRGALVKAVLPTAAPPWFDRSATVVAMVVGTAVAAWAAAALWRSPTNLAGPAAPTRRPPTGTPRSEASTAA